MLVKWWHSQFLPVATGLLVSCSVIVPPAATAEGQSDWDLYYGAFQDGKRVYVFADKVNIRQNAAEDAPSVGVVTAGSELVIRKRSEKTLTKGGFSDYWYEVNQPREKDLAPAFVWGGALAKAATKLPPDVNQHKERLVLVGISSGKEQFSKRAEARLVTSGNIVSNISFEPIALPESASFGYSMKATTLRKQGFDGDPRFVKVTFSYEACDYPNGDVLLSVLNNQLQYVGTFATSSNETGSSQVDYIFPEDKGGKRNQFKVVRTVRNNEEKRSETFTEIIAWDGVRWKQTKPVRKAQSTSAEL